MSETRFRRAQRVDPAEAGQLASAAPRHVPNDEGPTPPGGIAGFTGAVEVNGEPLPNGLDGIIERLAVAEAELAEALAKLGGGMPWPPAPRVAGAMAANLVQLAQRLNRLL